ncbi:hypothetical protein [Amycolatopsis sp. CFH S0078]|uniref:hypothetical protein n=1 Tax=Amycolatopsis sp. CFH S0078 TaxID=1644108 RepID=UPI00106DDDB1|nr:hypothetical protein [Amycolatopsis sp. CFH S0078]
MSGLAVPNPSTLAPGNLVTGALWNAQVRDSVNFLGYPPIFLASSTATTSIPNRAWTVVSLGSLLVDTYGAFNASNSSFVAPVTGWYYCTGTVAWPSSGVGVRATAFYKNGAVYNPGSYGMLPSTNSSFIAQGVQGTQLMYLAQGDYVQLMASQDTGGTISTGNFSYLPTTLMIFWTHG